MNYTKMILASAAFLAASNALAGGDHKPKFGGVVQEVNEIQYELVAKADTIALFIEDHGKPVDTKGATAKITLLADKEKSDVVLSPVGGNKMEAKGTFNAKTGTKVVAVIALSGRATTAVRFVVP